MLLYNDFTSPIFVTFKHFGKIDSKFFWKSTLFFSKQSIILLKRAYIKIQQSFSMKADRSRPLFIYFCLFNTVDNKQVNKQMSNINFADDWSLTADLWY